MDLSLIVYAVTFALVVATVAFATAAHRGPLAFILSRLHANRGAYMHVTTLLWGVVAGLLALPALARLWPAETAAYGAIGFVVRPCFLRPCARCFGVVRPNHTLNRTRRVRSLAFGRRLWRRAG